jgi:hypothetical protein
MSWREINSNLEKIDKKQIISIVKAMYTAHKVNKTFLSATFCPNSFDKILEEAKQQIVNQFFPKRGYGKCNLVVIKKVISNYNKTTNDTVGYLDLMLSYIEEGTDFINTYGDIKENAYGSMQDTFEKFSTHLKKEQNVVLFDIFKNRIEKLKDNVYGIGYGFGDEVCGDAEELLEYFEQTVQL